jgi:hypothetical protein
VILQADLTLSIFLSPIFLLRFWPTEKWGTEKCGACARSGVAKAQIISGR